jgi:hypothetical protein
MALIVVCDMCGKELDEPGALLFAPPHASPGEFPTSRKLHACRACWAALWGWMFPVGAPTPTMVDEKWRVWDRVNECWVGDDELTHAEAEHLAARWNFQYGTSLYVARPLPKNHCRTEARATDPRATRREVVEAAILDRYSRGRVAE